MLPDCRDARAAGCSLSRYRDISVLPAAGAAHAGEGLNRIFSRGALSFDRIGKNWLSFFIVQVGDLWKTENRARGYAKTLKMTTVRRSSCLIGVFNF